MEVEDLEKKCNGIPTKYCFVDHGRVWWGSNFASKSYQFWLSQTYLAIEVYPLCLQLLLTAKGERAIVRISKKETIGELDRKACEVFDLMLDQVSIWDYYGHQKHALMDDMEKNLDDANIQMDQDDLYWTRMTIVSQDLIYTSRSFSTSVDFIYTAQREKPPLIMEVEDLEKKCNGIPMKYCFVDHGRETVGELDRKAYEVFDLMLDQVSIWDYYGHQKHALIDDMEKNLDDANIQMDQDGELALAFGELLRKLWTPGRTPVSPRPFKTKLARFAQQFSGSNQHDSQELLAFLLDGLHEELNRVKHKPYIDSKDADGRPDEEVVDEYWANHIA